MNKYPCSVVRIIDGDTLVLKIDLGFSITTIQRVRLLGVDTPEINRKISQEAGYKASLFVQKWVLDSESDLIFEHNFTVETKKQDGFGRYLGIFRNRNEESLSDDLIKSGHGVPYKK